MASSLRPSCPGYTRALSEQIARCDREIAAIDAEPSVIDGTAPAWLVTLGREDWEAEKRWLVERGEAR